MVFQHVIPVKITNETCHAFYFPMKPAEAVALPAEHTRLGQPVSNAHCPGLAFAL